MKKILMFGIMAAIVTGTITTSVIVFAHGGDINLIHACVNKSDGRLNVIPAGEQCKSSQFPLDWNIAGIPGLPGDDGQDGTHCWDLDENGSADFPDEDVNGDSEINVLDCKGSPANFVSQRCPDGEVMIGINSDGTIVCTGSNPPIIPCDLNQDQEITAQELADYLNDHGIPVSVEQVQEQIDNVEISTGLGQNGVIDSQEELSQVNALLVITGIPECPDNLPVMDEDGDGVSNANDSCPQIPGPAENNGCPFSFSCDVDADCPAGEVCQDTQCVQGIEICDNGVDDDNDGRVDSADPNCPEFCQPLEDGNECTFDFCDADTGQVLHPHVSDGTLCVNPNPGTCVSGECIPIEICDNGVDDDNDQLVDLDDPDCVP